MSNKVLKVAATLGIAIIKIALSRGADKAGKKVENYFDRKCS